MLITNLLPRKYSANEWYNVLQRHHPISTYEKVISIEAIVNIRLFVEITNANFLHEKKHETFEKRPKSTLGWHLASMASLLYYKIDLIIIVIIFL